MINIKSCEEAYNIGLSYIKDKKTSSIEIMCYAYDLFGPNKDYVYSFLQGVYDRIKFK